MIMAACGLMCNQLLSLYTDAGWGVNMYCLLWLPSRWEMLQLFKDLRNRISAWKHFTRYFPNQTVHFNKCCVSRSDQCLPFQ